MKRGMDKAVEDIVEGLKKMSVKVSNKGNRAGCHRRLEFDHEVGTMTAEATEKSARTA